MSQYRYLTSIEDLAMIQKVLTRTLDFNITLTHKELLALASKLCKQVKELTTIKRYSIGITALYDDIKANVIVMQELKGLDEEVYYKSKVLTKDSLPLYIIKVDIEGRYEVNVILNQGATICIIRENV